MGRRRTFRKKAQKALSSDIRMISGCEDVQTSADVSNVYSFRLPDPAGRSGGACTSALLKVLYNEQVRPTNDLAFVEVLTSMREVLDRKGYSQIPQLSSSTKIDVNDMFALGGEDGVKRALLIGINYVGQEGELSGCHNDVLNIKAYLMDVHGFEEENMIILMDDGENELPTKENILSAYTYLVENSVDGDAVFCHYSGHGGKVRDDDWGEEEDGYDETLIPVDYMNAGQIRDDTLFSTLVQPMADGVTVTCLMDCCHSGTVLDLPYKYKADSEDGVSMEDDKFKFGKILGWLGFKEEDISDDEDESDNEL